MDIVEEDILLFSVGQMGVPVLMGGVNAIFIQKQTEEFSKINEKQKKKLKEYKMGGVKDNERKLLEELKNW